MAEEKVEVKTEEKPVEPNKDFVELKALVDSYKTQVDSLAKKLEEKEKEITELKAFHNDLSTLDKVKAEIEKDVFEKLKVESKALVEPNQEKFEEAKTKVAEIKSLVKDGKLDVAWREAAKAHDSLIGG